MAKKKRGLLGRLGTALREAVFDTAGHGRHIRAWQPGISGPNANLMAGPAAMRDRSRDLTRKFALLNGAYDTISSNIVGTGIRALSKAQDRDIRRKITDVWQDWCGCCGYRGRQPLGGYFRYLRTPALRIRRGVFAFNRRRP